MAPDQMHIIVQICCYISSLLSSKLKLGIRYFLDPLTYVFLSFCINSQLCSIFLQHNNNKKQSAKNIIFLTTYIYSVCVLCLRSHVQPQLEEKLKSLFTVSIIFCGEKSGGKEKFSCFIVIRVCCLNATQLICKIPCTYPYARIRCVQPASSMVATVIHDSHATKVPSCSYDSQVRKSATKTKRLHLQLTGWIDSKHLVQICLKRAVNYKCFVRIMP